MEITEGYLKWGLKPSYQCKNIALLTSKIPFHFLKFLFGNFAFGISFLQYIQSCFRFCAFAMMLVRILHPRRSKTSSSRHPEKEDHHYYAHYYGEYPPSTPPHMFRSHLFYSFLLASHKWLALLCFIRHGNTPNIYFTANIGITVNIHIIQLDSQIKTNRSGLAPLSCVGLILFFHCSSC